MSYIDILQIRDEICVWERTEKGREIRLFHAPYHFYIPNPKGEYTSIYGDKLEKLEFKTKEEFKLAKNHFKGKTQLFESDIEPTTRILSEHYYQKEPPGLHTCYFDIEVDYDIDRGFASVEEPYAPINSIALYNDWQNRMVLIAVPPDSKWYSVSTKEILDSMNKVAPLPKDVEIDIYICSGERDLLSRFLSEIKDSDVLSGWNSRVFDLPYLGARLERIGKSWLRKLTFEEAPKPRWGEVERMGGTSTILEMVGRISLDYLEVFKKFEVTERPSFKLESIADEVLPDMPKLEYEGSLADLYKKDFIWFIRYNIRDTEILKGFEERLGYIDLANRFVHDAPTRFKNLLGTLKLAEDAIMNYCHHEKNVIVYNKDTKEIEDTIQGAFVLEPQVGMHEFIGSVDLNSLYPSVIRTINISPEKIIGQFDENENAFESISSNQNIELTCLFEDGEQKTASALDWKELCTSNKWAVSAHGTIFDQNSQGIIPSIVSHWMSSRKEYQKLKAEFKEKGNKEKSTYYDKLQYIQKIKNNSLFGAISNQYFRFFDLRAGESITGTGKVILMHMVKKVAELLDNEYTYPSESILAGDTDSVYFNTQTDNAKHAILVSDRISELVNETFDSFVSKTFLCTSDFNGIIRCGREIVADRGIFVAKKMYMLHIIDNEGYASDKLKVMGLATKRTTLPKEIANYINDSIKDFLKGSSWDDFSLKIVQLKEELQSSKDIMRIGLPKGVKKVEEYTQRLEREHKVNLPGHVAASIFWNQNIDKYQDKLSPRITSGMKIRVFYLNQTYGRFKSIAIPTDIDKVPDWVLENYTVDTDAQIERLVDKPIEGIMAAIGKKVPTKQDRFADSILEF